MSGKPEGYFGQQGASADTSESNATDFQIQQALAQVRTTVPVKIIAVHGGGTGGGPPTVDVQPLINQIDGQGNKTDHGVIYGIPCMRSQGGGATIVMDPSVGDIGMMSIADRDISSLKSNKGAQSNPGSFRRHDLADGIYTGPILNANPPTKFIHLTGDGISMQDEHGNKLSSSGAGWNFNGVVIDSSGNIKTPGGITAGDGTGDSVTLQHHRHAGGPPPDPGT